MENRNGNQAMLITYLQLDSTEDFELHLPRETPFLLPPNGSFTLRIKSGERQGSGSATLFVKAAGKAAPLEIKVTRK